MKRTIAVAVGSSVALFAASAAADVSIGSQLGIAADIIDDRDDNVTFAVPFGVAALRPGFRLGFTGDYGQHEGFVDIGSQFGDVVGGVRGIHVVTGNYQYNFSPRSFNTFFLTAGGGFFWWNLRNEGDVFAPVVGGGLGLRQRVARDGGTLREEFRIDVQPDTQRFRPTTLMLSFRFGFDLWFR
jgi:hypothetical protein